MKKLQRNRFKTNNGYCNLDIVLIEFAFEEYIAALRMDQNKALADMDDMILRMTREKTAKYVNNKNRTF